jgi:hypothetical protein
MDIGIRDDRLDAFYFRHREKIFRGSHALRGKAVICMSAIY